MDLDALPLNAGTFLVTWQALNKPTCVVAMSEPIIIERLGFPTPHLEGVMALHRLNARTLGFLPKGAFEEYAKQQQIIIALTNDGNCLGYLLYRVARGRASIVHLCVADIAREYLSAI
jgi:hypothetical protein